MIGRALLRQGVPRRLEDSIVAGRYGGEGVGDHVAEHVRDQPEPDRRSLNPPHHSRSVNAKLSRSEMHLASVSERGHESFRCHVVKLPIHGPIMQQMRAPVHLTCASGLRTMGP